MSAKKLVGLVLINYRDYAARFLEDCRLSLLAQDYPANLRRIYVVDNASTPESFRYLEQAFPEARILSRPDGNYAAANNLGFSQAAADGCEYLVGVNMDTIAQPSWLSALVSALEDNPTAGIAQSKILLYTQQKPAASAKINSLGNVFHFLGFGFTSGYGQPDRELAGYPEIGGYASGCSLIIRTIVWQKIGGYNEEFYMYHDDVEISLKARLAGYRIILAPLSVISHKYEFNRSIRMLYYIERNRLLTLAIFYPVWLLVILAPALLFVQLGLLFYAFKKGWLKTALSVYAYFLQPGRYRWLKDCRRQIKSFSKLPFKEVAASFSGRLDFMEIDNPLIRLVMNPTLDIYWRLVKKIFRYGA